MRITADFFVHTPEPASSRDWADIAGALQTAGETVGLDLLGVFTLEEADDGADE